LNIDQKWKFGDIQNDPQVPTGMGKKVFKKGESTYQKVAIGKKQRIKGGDGREERVGEGRRRLVTPRGKGNSEWDVTMVCRFEREALFVKSQGGGGKPAGGRPLSFTRLT